MVDYMPDTESQIPNSIELFPSPNIGPIAILANGAQPSLLPLDIIH